MEIAFTPSMGGCIGCICSSCPKGYIGDRTCKNLCDGYPGHSNCHHRTNYCSQVNISNYTLDTKTSHTKNSDPYYEDIGSSSFIEK